MDIKSNEERKNNVDMHTFAQILTAKKLMNGTYRKSKQIILSNILKLTIYHSSSLSAISLKDTVKNSLTLDVNTAIVSANYLENNL